MKNVAIITGGESAEREISLRSAENIKKVIEVLYPVDIFVFPEDKNRFLKKQKNISIVIPVIHGKGGEDGEVQEWLEAQNIPYIFSPVAAHKAALQKDVAKAKMNEEGIKTPEGFIATKENRGVYPGYAVVVKPCDGGSSVATCIANTDEEYKEAIANALKITDKAIVERYIQGREFTIGVIEMEERQIVLPVVEIVAQSFFDYKQKYNKEDLAKEICPADIDAVLDGRLKDIASVAHRKLGCSHVTRTDVIMDMDGNLWFLEINTIPGYTQTSLMPKMLKQAGISEETLFSEWIEKARKK